MTYVIVPELSISLRYKCIVICIYFGTRSHFQRDNNINRYPLDIIVMELCYISSLNLLICIYALLCRVQLIDEPQEIQVLLSFDTMYICYCCLFLYVKTDTMTQIRFETDVEVNFIISTQSLQTTMHKYEKYFVSVLVDLNGGTS